MTLFAIFSKPDAGPDAIVLVPERFVWSAFVLTPVWALAKGAWAHLALCALAIALAFGLAAYFGAAAGFAFYAVFALWSGFAAPAIASRALQTRGWLAHGEMAAPDMATAEHFWLTQIYGSRP